MSQAGANSSTTPIPVTVVETLTGNTGGAVSPTSNNINTVGTGSITIAGNPGTSTLTTQLTGLTNHNVLVGAGTATITNVSPSATSGVPLISNGVASDPSFGTASIAGGGTNATSMSTSNGIVKYDGTSLVTSTTAKIDASNRLTNTSQPAFQAYLSLALANATGDGTAVAPVPFNSTVFNQGSVFNTSTSTFTAPVSGVYLFSCLIFLEGLTSSHTVNNNFLVFSTPTYGSINFMQGNLGNTRDANGNFQVTASFIANMAAADTLTMALQIFNGAKVVTIAGGAQGTNLSGYLVC